MQKYNFIVNQQLVQVSWKQGTDVYTVSITCDRYSDTFELWMPLEFMDLMSEIEAHIADRP
jgi:hypothetical protein